MICFDVIYSSPEYALKTKHCVSVEQIKRNFNLVTAKQEHISNLWRWNNCLLISCWYIKKYWNNHSLEWSSWGLYSYTVCTNSIVEIGTCQLISEGLTVISVYLHPGCDHNDENWVTYQLNQEPSGRVKVPASCYLTITARTQVLED